MTPHLSLHCYLQDTPSDQALPCSDMTIHADPATLRAIAHFLLASADEFDLAQERAGMHAHLQDAWAGKTTSPTWWWWRPRVPAWGEA